MYDSNEMPRVQKKQVLTEELLNNNSATSLPPVTPSIQEFYLTALNESDHLNLDYYPKNQLPLKQLRVKRIKGEIGKRLDGQNHSIDMLEKQ